MVDKTSKTYLLILFAHENRKQPKQRSFGFDRSTHEKRIKIEFTCVGLWPRIFVIPNEIIRSADASPSNNGAAAAAAADAMEWRRHTDPCTCKKARLAWQMLRFRVHSIWKVVWGKRMKKQQQQQQQEKNNKSPSYLVKTIYMLVRAETWTSHCCRTALFIVAGCCFSFSIFSDISIPYSQCSLSAIAPPIPCTIR